MEMESKSLMEPHYSLEKSRIIYFMNSSIRRANDYNSAIQKMITLLKPYEVLGNVAALPDFTDSNTLPIGTTAVISKNNPINPALIGMDIGCGYSFFSIHMNPKRLYKKGKVRIKTAQSLVSSIENSISGIERGRDNEIGTIGKGNHFIDIFIIEKMFDNILDQFGLSEDQVYFMIHSGSRTKGFETYQHFSKRFQSLDIQDINEFNSDYLEAFNEARTYARINRDLIRHAVENATGEESRLFFDKTHNDILIQEDGLLKLMKGTSSLNVGEFFVIPGTATNSAYAIVGLDGLSKTHFSINHGCGRKYTRSQLLKRFLKDDLSKVFQDVALNVYPNKMIEELPIGYKRIEDVIDSIEEFNLARRIAKLRPVGVIVDRGENYGRK